MENSEKHCSMLESEHPFDITYITYLVSVTWSSHGIVFEQILLFTTMLTTLVTRSMQLLHDAKHNPLHSLVDYRRLPQMPGEQKVSL